MWIAGKSRRFSPAALALCAACGEIEPPHQPLEPSVDRARQAVVGGPKAWFETQKIHAPSPERDDFFGNRVALSEDMALVTMSVDGGERVYAFRRSASGFGEPQELVVEGVASIPEYDVSLATTGQTAIVGTPRTDVAQGGAAYVFSYDGSSWELSQRLISDDNDGFFHHFGAAVSIDGDVAVIGAPWADAAYVYSRSEGAFTQVKKLVASDARQGPGLRTAFGTAVAISGSDVIVGAPDYDVVDEATNTIAVMNRGAAYRFSAPGELSGTWNESKLLASDGAHDAFFGMSVAIDASGVLVGAPGRSGLSEAGTVYAFTPDGSGWREEKIEPGRAGDDFGISLSLSGSTLLVGAPLEELAPAFLPGTARVYARSATEWIERQMLVASDGKTWEGFGSAVAISGDTILVSAPWRTSGVVYVETLLGATGSSCAVDTDCGLGHCVAGICCESACDGPCEECPNGTCNPADAGSPGSPPCEPYLCDGADRACPNACSDTRDCAGTHYCADGECEPKAGNGEPCSEPDECASENCVRGRCSGDLPNGAACSESVACDSGHCVDGVCCDDSCRGQCEACDVPGAEGECSAVEGAPPGGREPCAGSHRLCVSFCDGETRDACVYPPSSTPCGSECADSIEITRWCDGRGDCVARNPMSCEPFACDGDRACKESCASNDDCAVGFACWPDGTCGAPLRCVSAHESQAAGAPVRDCRPYRCDEKSGACWERCTSVDECSPGNVCRAGECKELPVGESADCACRAARRSRGGAWWLLALFGSMLFAHRRAFARSGANGRQS